VDRAKPIVFVNRRLSPRDAPVAVVEREGVHCIRSPDRGLDGLPEIERLG
jgi:hypothetical protein